LKLEFESGQLIQDPTDDDFLLIEGEEFAILSGADVNTYIQCAERGEAPWGYILEYQDGSLDQHFQAVGGPISLKQIVASFRKYCNGDASWLTDFEWERIELS